MVPEKYKNIGKPLPVQQNVKNVTSKSVPAKQEQPKLQVKQEDDSVICDSCNKPIDKGKIKYVPKDDSTVLTLCPACSGTPSKSKTINLNPKTVSKKTTYKCTRCDYEFKFNIKGSAELKCPYCGRSDRLKEHIPAEEIIKGIKPSDED
jgi:DNA-directed RNA polymerase subunit RPC12/RpoP